MNQFVGDNVLIGANAVVIERCSKLRGSVALPLVRL